MADRHLKYVGAGGQSTTYEVYDRATSTTLGRVELIAPRHWVAIDLDGYALSGSARWEAAVSLWGEA